ncbi:xanthine phosphoribosyltransferase [Aedoeadaptatus urinae]|uniref:xanthine phosphoribosyltransferase n=1 Tax=Aedoeadaptatus urinae TaxID=1871017 RepID=UPI00097DD0A9|nr:xanthine phosphoribosyltransferase [Peptoniphilus urinae]
MGYLKERIKNEGVIYPGNVLKIDSFLNHQIDPTVMKEIEGEFYDYFKDRRVTKVLTVEASGIAPAIMVAAHFGVPMLFAKKARPSTLKEEDVYVTDIFSYTKNTSSKVVVNKSYLKAEDSVLIIDDFLANGEASLGLVDIVKQAGATVAGIGICVEKSFQPGRERLEEVGLDVYSIVRIEAIDSDKQCITFKEGH